MTPPRAYDSTLRARKAEETRQAVLDAARDLFRKQAYVGTTIAMIAEAAHVAEPTIYAAFGSKRGIVAALLERARFGAAYKEAVAKAIATEEPEARLRQTAAIARSVFEGESAELELLRGAGVLSPELADLISENEAARMKAQAPTITLLRRSGRLRDGIDETSAHDILWMLTSRDVYRLLVIARGWTPDRYEAWLGEMLVSALLGQPRRSAKANRRPQS